MSVEACHDTVACVVVTPEADRLVGIEGAVVSVGGGALPTGVAMSPRTSDELSARS